MTTEISRRAFLKGSGVLIVAFTLPFDVAAESAPGGRVTDSDAPGHGAGAADPSLDQLDSWLAIHADGGITLYSGKVELGTGVQTALSQIVAEELDVPVSRISVVQGETGRTPNQGSTTGSKTLQRGGVQVRRAAAEARHALLGLAAARLGVPAAQLDVTEGTVTVSGDRGTAIAYGGLIGDRRFHHRIPDGVITKAPGAYSIVGRSVPRMELPAKLTGTHRYVHDVQVPGMLHGRVVRPPAVGARLAHVDERSVAGLPGSVRVVRRGNFVGVVAEREEQAIEAARRLAVRWTPPAHPLPEGPAIHQRMRDAVTSTRVLAAVGDVAGAFAGAATTRTASYRTPFQSHGSIGPSCGVADVRDGAATIWSGTQGAYALRGAIAALLGFEPERVHVIWTEASGCYGHNGADDAAADAALLSQAVERPVRVQWSRADELGWDPKTPAMLMDVRGALDERGRVVAWDYTVTTPTHSTRPGRDAANLLAGQLMGLEPRMRTVGGDRNAPHDYTFPNSRVAVRWLDWSPLRPSAMRGLGAPANVFANESFMDELAAAAGVDPVAFRLRVLQDPRAIEVVQRAAALARWDPRSSPARGAHGSNDEIASGRGLAFARYENRYTYVATVAEVEVDRRTGSVRVPRTFVAHDCGLIVNPDGLRNQIEGATIQSISRALKEEVRVDHSAVTSVDWRSYPILTFPEVPEAIEIALIDRPEEPAWGAGEPAACTVAAAIANAIFDATGARLRELPFTPDRVRHALG